MSQFWSILFVAVLISGLLCPPVARAQAPTGEIAGTVTDPSDAVMAGVQIAVVNRSTGVSRASRTNEVGFYSFPALPAGTYEVSAQQTGFRRANYSNITVTALSAIRLDVVMQLGEVADVVTVTSEVPLVETRSSVQGVLVDDRRIRDLPLNGRNAVDLVLLAPGINNANTTIESSFSQQRLVINGGRQTGVNFLLDGGQQNFFHRGSGLLLPPPDALQEFKLATVGTPAEYGRGAATLSAVTRSGGNEFHGSAWHFLRNDAFDARSFFAANVPKLRFNQFGATFGGPVLIPKLYNGRGKNFFFISYQGLRIRRDSVSSSANPLSGEERTGNFSAAAQAIVDPLTGQPFPGRQMPATRIDPVAARIVQNYVPLPNRPTGQFVSQVSEANDGDQFLGRWDSVLSDKNRLNVRYFRDRSVGTDPFPNGSTLPDYSPVGNGQQLNTITVEDNHTFTPNVLLTTRVNYTRFDYNEANTVRTTLDQLGATNFVHAGGPVTLPRLQVSGRFLLSPGRDRRRLSENIDFSQNLTWIKGSHQFKFGADIQRNRFMYRDNQSSGGQFNFDGTATRVPAADFLLGSVVRLQQASPLDTDQRYFPWSVFAQDTWRVHRRLTLNYGVRMEAYPAWQERFGQATAFVPGARSSRFPNAPEGVVFQDDSAFPLVDRLWNPAPRLGIAWDVFGNGKTSVRTSWGMFIEPLTAEMTGGVQSPQPFALVVDVNNRSLSAPYVGQPIPFPYEVDPANATFRTPVVLPKSFAQGVRNPYTMNYNFGIQQQMGGNWVLDVSYVGNAGRHFANLRQANPAVFRPGATTGNTNARRIYAPAIGSIGELSTGTNTRYDSLQVAVLRRFARGFTVNANYTWSKAIDEVTSGESFAQISQQSPQDPFNRRADRALNSSHASHRWAGSYLYQLPIRLPNAILQAVVGGWELGGLVTVQTGNPVGILSGADNSRTGVGFDRPNVVGNPVLSADRTRAERINRFFDTTAFVANPIGTFGNSGRNPIIGTGSFVWNTSLLKNFIIHEKHRLQFRWEMFNASNTPVLSNPVGTLNSPAFGRIQGAGPGRIQQLSLKYEF
jgi:hypothetical protein